jgi:outer membrane receptor protein involved in Fe transport
MRKQKVLEELMEHIRLQNIMSAIQKIRKTPLLCAVIAAGLMAMAVTPAALAQTSKGTLTGVVRDSSEAVIVGVEVTATNVSTNEVRTAKTSSLGAYRFDAIAPGQYNLVFQASGFERSQATGITVPPSQAVSYDLVLKPGRVDQMVSVTADTVLLNQENASLSGTIPQTAMENLPIFSLNPIEVLTTVPGVQIVSNSDMSNGTSIQVSGARPRSNNFLIDGEEINDAGIGGQAVQPQIADMYSDTVIYTHNPPAEYGRASGGVINMITKGGTNTLHGGVWDRYSGSGLSATDGLTRQIVPKDRANKARWNEHDIGFTAGGPIIKNKLFVFGAAQWTHTYGNEQRDAATLPDADGIALLQAIASQTGSPTTATQAALMLNYLGGSATVAPAYLTTFNVVGPFDDNGNPDPASLGLGDACPTEASCSLTTLDYQSLPTPMLSSGTQWSYRIDYTPWAKDTFSARYMHDRTSLSPDFYANSGALPGFETEQGGPSELGQGAWTHIFSPKVVNEFRVSETRPSFAFAPTAATLANPLYNTPTISISGLHDLGPDQNFPQGRSQQMYQFQDTVSLTFGRHTVRMGADIGRRIEKDLVSQNAKGTLTFAEGGTGSSSAGNFLLNQLGPSGSATVTYGSTRIDPHSWRSGIFAQDDIKLRQDLTVNLGVRYDYFTAPENSLPYPSIDPNNPYQPIDTVIPVAPDKNNFAPRVGFAYTPRLGNLANGSNTVIRGGFGIFFDSDFTNIAVNLQQSAPNAVSGTLTSTGDNGLADATSLISQIPEVLNDYSSVGSVVNNMVAPYTEEWNLGIDRQLPGQFAVSVTYVGSHGVKLFANQNYNFFDFNTGERLNTSRGSITGRANTGASSYNGLEVGVKRNMSHGIAITGAYVYSKTLDNASEVFAADSAATSYSADLRPGGRKYDWGNSAYDHRQYAAFTYVWSPAGLRSSDKGADTLLSALTRHWTFSGSSRFQSGAYSTINTAFLDTNGDGSAYNDRPLLSNPSAPIDSVAIDGVWLGDPGTYYDWTLINASDWEEFNTIDANSAHWIIPYGANLAPQEIGRNSFLNPGTMYHDIALEKDVPTSFLHLDRGQLVFRVEVENLANHNNINVSGDDYLEKDLYYAGTSTFMYQDREANNRSLRFWAKFTF